MRSAATGWVLRGTIALVALLAVALPAAGGDPEWTPEQREALRAGVERLRTMLRSNRLSAKNAAAFDLDLFDGDDLAHVPMSVEGSAELRDAVAHVCRTAVFRRGPLGRLERASDACFLLASEQPADWMDAYRLLRREPLGEDLDRAVIALGRNARPEFRLIAIRHATTLVFFGRETDGLLATVLAGLRDLDPDVAANCVFYAEDTGDKRAVDGMVACLGDDRALADGPLPPPFLRLHGYGKVSALAASRLGWMIYQEREARIPFRHAMPGPEGWRPARFQVEHVALAPDEIRTWWKQNRAAFGFRTPRPMWKRVLDTVAVLQRGRPIVVRIETGEPLRMTLHRYTEGWDDRGSPVTTIEMEIVDARSPECLVVGVGNPEHDDWWVSGSGSNWTLDGVLHGSLWCKAAFLPTHERGQVRMKIVLDVEGEPGTRR